MFTVKIVKFSNHQKDDKKKEKNSISSFINKMCILIQAWYYYAQLTLDYKKRKDFDEIILIPLNNDCSLCVKPEQRRVLQLVYIYKKDFPYVGMYLCRYVLM